jgi:MSHA biogenesis protein MshQ
MLFRMLVAASAMLWALNVHAQGATLVGEYRFDAPSATVIDSSGGGHNGTVSPAGSIGWSSAAPARPGSPGTCGYSTLSRAGSAAITGLPVSTSPGARTSVGFWMYWDGTDNMMPIGWQRHDLWLYNGAFGFNTSNSDIFGISSAGLAGGWHHVVAVFNNGDYTLNKIYIDGAARTLSQQFSFQTPAYAFVQSTMYIGSWGYDPATYLFSGRIDEVRVYNGELSPSEVTALYTAVRACPDRAPTEVPALAPLGLAALASLLGLGGLAAFRRRAR